MGALAKQMADNTVKRQHITHDAARFVAAWGHTATEIHHMKVPVEAIATVRLDLLGIVCGHSVKGTRKAHAAVCGAPAIRSCQSAGTHRQVGNCSGCVVFLSFCTISLANLFVCMFLGLV